MRTTATILLAGLLLAGPAAAQDTNTGTAATQPESVEFVAKQQENQDLMSRFLGTPVVNPEGETLGKVNDMALNTAGQVEVIVIGVGGFLGVGEKNVGVPYDALARQAGEEGQTQLVLDATQGDLTDAPEYLTSDNQSLSLTKRLRERAGELTEEAKETYEKAKERVMEEAEQLNQ
ncbi:PRC-barrel domain-containing protein [Dichotomicrobium thermohalophilum]|uniref:PRC-barrel domain protein n=1 Tax=Dichotomicrobium thermohalophilum TaxID=933063 RepID=A0A397PFK5_9HYPH|nr:PRC-barrel domain-containing protein [Dichotomicrobium thermohalophilum]RIA47802.1 PRC-barrel domain protein [Dichotomicrobium thermohalophilum]